MRSIKLQRPRFLSVFERVEPLAQNFKTVVRKGPRALPAVLVSILISVWPVSAESAAGPSDVRIRLVDNRYQLTVNNKPFYIKGGGIEWGSPEKLRAHGGNSF